MPLDPKFTKFTTASPVLANYDYVDIMEGTGTIVYYLCQTSAGHTLAKNIFPNLRDNFEISTTSNSSGAIAVKRSGGFSLSTYNFPQTIKGTAYLDISTKLKTNSGAGRSAYMVVTFQKVSASAVVTDMGTVNTRDWGATDNSSAEVYPIELTETNFAVGDKVRLLYSLYMKPRDAGGACVFIFGFDPLNRDGTELTPSSDANVFTRAKLYIPYKLNL